jgi:translocation and assembly module TamB
MKKRLLFLLSVFIPLLILLGLGLTSTGLSLLSKGINTLGGEGVSIEEVEGRLLNSFKIKNVQFDVAQVQFSLVEFSLDWRPLQLLTGKLHLVEVKASGLHLTFKKRAQSEKDPEGGAFELPAVILPLAVEIDRFSLQKIILADDDGGEPLHLDKIAGGLSGNTRGVSIEHFELSGPDIGLLAHGNIRAEKMWTIDMMGTWRLAGLGFHPMSGTYALKGPLEMLDVSVALVKPGDIRVAGRLHNLLGDASWTATLEGGAIELSKWIEYCPEIVLSSAYGELQGDFGTYRGKVQIDGEWGPFDALQLNSRLDGNGLGIFFHSFRIERADGYVTADGGSISWAKLFSWESDLFGENFDPSRFSENMQGRLGGRFRSVGNVTDDGLDASFDIRNISGILNDLPFSVTGTMALTGDGISSEELRVRSGSYQGTARVESAEFTWDEKSIWAGKVHFEKFNPAVFHKELYGEITTSVEGRGRWNSSGFLGKVQISDISGMFRNNELSGGGEFEITDTFISSDGFLLNAGDSKLHIQASLGEEMDLLFDFSSPDLNSLIPGMSGVVDVSGALTGRRAVPDLLLDVTGSDLEFKGIKLGKTDSRFQAQLSRDGRVSARVNVEGLEVSGTVFQSGDLTLEGTVGDHLGTTALNGEKQSIGGTFSGAFDNGWKGGLSQLYFKALERDLLRQLGSGKARVNQDRLSLEGFCFGFTDKGNIEKDSVCIDGLLEYEEDLLWTFESKMMEASLSLLNQFIFLPISLAGTIQGTLSASGNSTDIVSGAGEIHITDGLVQFEGDEVDETVLTLKDSKIEVELVEQVLRTTVEIHEKNGGLLNFDTRVEGVGPLSASFLDNPLSGDVSVHKFRPAILTFLNIYGIQPSGKLNSTLVLAGTVARPKVFGEITLDNGEIDLTYQGITLKEISIELTATPDGAKLLGRARSGDGFVTADGFIHDGGDGFSGTIDLVGENFLLVNLPEYTFTVTPSMVFDFDQQKGEINGSVEVIQGLIEPEELKGTVKVSEDVIFEGDDEKILSSHWPLHLDLEVLAGENVHIDGYGLKGRLGGKLRVRKKAEDFVTGTGELDLLDGIFSIYGRSLDIERGTVLFTGGPLDNPGLDVRAQKTVDDKQARGKGYTVGVDIYGLVQNLQFNLFSDPYMSDTEILSHMVVGHSIAGSTQAESSLLQAAASTLGVAEGTRFLEGLSGIFIDDLHIEGSAKDEDVSLVLGKKITRDLYLGYDINMFSELGQFRVRYDLVRGFWVETSSSSESTGADLMFSFEK